MTWRPTPNGQPACSTRRRRSWRPSGYACSRTRLCGSVRSATCPPKCLRPGPARPASASPPPRVGAQANRCQMIGAGARRGDGHPCRYGLPSGPLRRTGYSAERHCRTREVMRPPMIISRQRHSCVGPQLFRCRVTAADFNVQSRSAHAPPLEVAYRSGPCTTSLPSPGRPQDHSGACPGIINDHQLSPPAVAASMS